MKVTVKGHTTLIKDSTDDLEAFVAKLTHEIHTFKEQNLIIDLSHYETVDKKQVLLLKPLSVTHKKNKKSFAVVVSATDFNAFSAAFTVVPSVLEAHDIIEMEEIERDLGF
ncbi:ribonuclease Z [Flavobacterium sp.]|jgi:hypothetical protein|uniref:ribonuclease Z n=1 Tax=Flavobacterium sp. TaxID=239 RepID=UPI0037BE72C8